MRRLTNESSVTQGVYHSDCKCRVEIRVRQGDKFPECPRCHRPVVWLFTRSFYEDPPKKA